jgi:hypothetical protein|tara:strand:+ start:629 stop:838 length:210 start_codon:yes stop_codon:yes gene_type:complete
MVSKTDHQRTLWHKWHLQASMDFCLRLMEGFLVGVLYIIVWEGKTIAEMIKKSRLEQLLLINSKLKSVK